MLMMLLEFVKEDEKAAFTRIYHKYERKMYAVARGFLGNQADAEDAVYESFEKIIKNFEKIISLSCTEMDGYIVTIVKNTARNMLKRRRNEPPPEEWEHPAAPESTEGEAGYHFLVELIRTMPEHYRVVLELALVLEWRIKDIARELKLSENTVSTRLTRGKKLLQDALKGVGYFDEPAGV